MARDRDHCGALGDGDGRDGYMCSYAVTGPAAATECRVMQARWTPKKASTITVTLADRAARCGSLREALHTLQ